MDAPLDLYRASREELIALVLRQREQIADLEQEVARLRGELATQRAELTRLTARVGTLLATLELPDDDAGASRPTTMPGRKPVGKGHGPTPPRARKRRAHGYGRRRMRATAHQVHALARCPHCRTALRGGTVKRTRHVLAVVPAPVVVTDPVSRERRCPRCGGRWLPGPDLDGVVVGQGRLGVGLLSLITTLREEWRLPIAAIQGYRAAVPGLRLSVGAIVGTLPLVAARAAPVVAHLREAIRASPVLHADETGWREAGVNGSVWTFSTAAARVFVRGKRERAVLEEAIGTDDGGVLVSAVSAASTTDEGRHHYGWAHLLRDVDELIAQHRGDPGVVGWADGVHAL